MWRSGTMARRRRPAGSCDARRDSRSAAADYSRRRAQRLMSRYAWRAPESGAVSVAIDDPAGLPADNERFVALGSRGGSKVLVIADGDGSLPLAGARSLQHASDEETVEVVPAARVARLTDEQLASYRGVVLLSTRGLERAARERLMSSVKNGGGLFIAAAPELELAVLAEMTGWQPPLTAAEQAGPLTLAATDVRHPIFRPLRCACRQPRSGAFRSRLARVVRRLVGRRSLLEWHAGAARARLRPRPRPALCVRCRPPVERLSLAPRVRAVRRREPSLRDGGPPSASGLHGGPGAGRGAACSWRLPDHGQSAVCGQRGPAGRVRANGWTRTDFEGYGASIGRGSRRRPPTGGRSEPSHGRVIGSMAWCS